MNKRKLLPEAYGEEVAFKEWSRIFRYALKGSPDINLFDSINDIGSELLSFEFPSKKKLELIIDDFSRSSRIDPSADNKQFLVRVQYYEAGLHHRLSFHATVIREQTFKEHPAIRLEVIPPIRRVTNLFVAYPSEDRPVFLEIPIAGAPPEVRVVEMSLERMKAFTPKTKRIHAKTKHLEGIRVQFIDIGEAEISGEMAIGDGHDINIAIDPLSKKSKQAFNNYLESEYEAEHKSEIRKQEKTKETKPAKKNGIVSSKSKAVIAVADEELGKVFEEVFSEFDWEVERFQLFEDVPRIAFKNADLLLLDSEQDEFHAVELLRELIRDEIIIPVRFILVGNTLEDAREPDWAGLGKGLFLRSSFPKKWIEKKISNWMKFSDTIETSTESGENRPLILVADDDPDMVDQLGSLLMERFYRVVVARNGQEAMQTAKNLKPNLIILDQEMPIWTGLDVLRMIRNLHITKDIPIIMLTGQSDMNKVREAVSVGISDYILKPFNEMALLERIKELVGS